MADDPSPPAHDEPPPETREVKRRTSPEAIARLTELRRLIAAQLKDNRLPHGL